MKQYNRKNTKHVKRTNFKSKMADVNDYTFDEDDECYYEQHDSDQCYCVELHDGNIKFKCRCGQYQKYEIHSPLCKITWTARGVYFRCKKSFHHHGHKRRVKRSVQRTEYN